MKLLKNKDKGISLVILVLLLIVLLLLAGCDKLKKCRPQVNIKTGYIGMVCSGDF